MSRATTFLPVMCSWNSRAENSMTKIGEVYISTAATARLVSSMAVK